MRRSQRTGAVSPGAVAPMQTLESYSSSNNSVHSNSEETHIAHKYRLREVIGSGGFGTVHKALDLTTGSLVAVKKIFVGNDMQEDSEVVEVEIALLKRLSHANIVKYFESYRQQEFLYIVLEYVEGGSLHELIERFGRLPEDTCALYMEQALSGIAFLHEKKIIHRDIKSSNLLLTKDGAVKVSDFGISRQLRTGEHATGCGTPNFMSPEAAEGKGCSFASDIWSVGATLYELLTGQAPYADVTHPQIILYKISVDGPPPLPADVEISAMVQDFLAQCSEQDPNDRPSAIYLSHHPWISRARKRKIRASSNMPSEADMEEIRDFQHRPQITQEDLDRAFRKLDFGGGSTSNSANGGSSSASRLRRLRSAGDHNHSASSDNSQAPPNNRRPSRSGPTTRTPSIKKPQESNLDDQLKFTIENLRLEPAGNDQND